MLFNIWDWRARQGTFKRIDALIWKVSHLSRILIASTERSTNKSAIPKTLLPVIAETSLQYSRSASTGRFIIASSVRGDRHSDCIQIWEATRRKRSMEHNHTKGMLESSDLAPWPWSLNHLYVFSLTHTTPHTHHTQILFIYMCIHSLIFQFIDLLVHWSLYLLIYDITYTV